METYVGQPAADGHPERWPQRPRRMALAVTDDLVDRIVGGQFPVGSPLPNEVELCEHYKASRTVIREAVQSAEAMRLVRAQQGLGTIVRPFDEWDLANPVVLAATIRHDAELAILEDLIDMRRALESQMAAHAAIRASQQDLERITSAYQATVAASNDPPAHLEADVGFHDAVMRASGNRLSRVANHKLLTEALQSLRYLGETTPEDCRRANVGHKAIHDRIAAGDPEGAAQAMNEHIISSWLRRRPGNAADPRLDAFRRRST
jgi:GntR family transcriptional regulator, galactonate operon transcriptional repressor